MTSEQAVPVSTGVGFWPHASPFRAQLPPLSETLEAEFNIAQMRALARLWDVKLKGSSRNGFVEQVAEALSKRVTRMRVDPDTLLEGLPEDQAQLARRLLTARDYELPVPRTLAANLWAGVPQSPPERPLADALDALRRRALIFPTNRYIGYRDVYYQWLPLAASGGNVPVITWSAGQPEPANHQSSIANFLDAFDIFLDAVISTGVTTRPPLVPHPQAGNTSWLRRWEHDIDEAQRLLNSRPGWAPDPRSGIGVPALSWLSADAKVTLENQTGLPTPVCEFLFAVAASLQLIEAPDIYPIPTSASLTNGREGAQTDTGWRLSARMTAVEEWFALTNEQRLLRAWAAWQENIPDAIEAGLAMRPARAGAPGQPFKVMRAIGARELGPLDLGAEWCALRRYLYRVLRGLPSGQWVDWSDLRRALFEFHPECAWSFLSPDHWWFARSDGMIRLQHSQYDDWVRSIGAVLEAALCGPLQWFGLVETDSIEANGEQDGRRGLRAFRVTELVDWLTQAQVATTANAVATLPAGGDFPALTMPSLPAAAIPQPRTTAPVVWLDERTWRLPPAPDRAEFIAFARKIGQPGEAPFTYTLTPASIESALQEGITAEQVLAQFERFGAPMPEPARELYRSIAQRFGRVRVYESLAVLQLSDDYALPELLSNTSLAQAIVYQISPRAVVVRPEKVNELVQEFVERGYTPSVA